MKDIALEQLVDIMPANLNSNSESDEEDSDSSSWYNFRVIHHSISYDPNPCHISTDFNIICLNYCIL